MFINFISGYGAFEVVLNDFWHIGLGWTDLEFPDAWMKLVILSLTGKAVVVNLDVLA